MTWELGADLVAADVPGYEVLNATGKGAMGRVFVARQTALGRLVAIKFLTVDDDANPVERLTRFRREAAIMASLAHPNVVSVHDFGEVDSRPYLVMEYVEGGDLRQRMPESGPMPIPAVLTLLTPIAQALAYLHSKGILHRDLKPENILMQGEVPKVGDFGIAVERSGSGELTRSGQGLGTLGYVAPEQQYRLPVDERADQYSLAALAYEMLTGVRPLGLFKAPSHHNPEATAEIDRVVLRALDDDPAQRFDSVLGFFAAFRAAVEQPRDLKPHETHRWRLVPVTMLGLAAAGLIWAASQGLLPGTPSPSASKAAAILPTETTPKWPELAPGVLEFLTSARAKEIWRSQGSPEGEAGQAVSRQNWYRAQGEVRAQVSAIANRMWKSRVRVGPPFDPDEVRQVWDDAAKNVMSDVASVATESKGQ